MAHTNGKNLRNIEDIQPALLLVKSNLFSKYIVFDHLKFESGTSSACSPKTPCHAMAFSYCRISIPIPIRTVNQMTTHKFHISD